ncbi:MAG: DUF615 domain-containing protein, partial [Myxococcota bacterium]|nr:DUF615 domain-containing protein [Myxococcota bacterium]
QLDSFAARRRLERHIVNLMREADEEVLEFLQQRLEYPEQVEAERQRRIDTMREHLMNDEGALSAFVSDHPDVPIQRLRQLLRACDKPRKRQELNALLQEALGL